MVLGGIEVDDGCDIVDVYAAGRDVGRDQSGRPAGAEVLEGAVTLVLRPVAVDRRSGHAGVAELLRDPVRSTLGAAEHDGRAHASDHLSGDGDPFGPVDVPEVVRQVGQLLLGELELVADRIVLVPPHQHVDVAVERGREEDGLTIGAAHVEELADLREETHVGHAVGLVEHHHVDVVETDQTLLDEVGQAPGAGHCDVDAPVEHPVVGADVGPSEEGSDAGPLASGDLLELLCHLGRELTGGHEHEPTRSARLRAGAVDDEGDAECQRLAGPGGGTAGDVAAGERVGHRQSLDGEGFVDAALGEGCDDPRGDAEVGEGRVHGGPVLALHRTTSAVGQPQR